MKDFDLGAGHIFALHLKETKPGVYRNMRFGSVDIRNIDGLSVMP